MGQGARTREREGGQVGGRGGCVGGGVSWSANEKLDYQKTSPNTCTRDKTIGLKIGEINGGEGGGRTARGGQRIADTHLAQKC